MSQISPCQSCGRTDRNWEETGVWAKCETCLDEFCGSCIGYRHVIYDGPSGGDFCKSCFDKIKIDDGKTSQCLRCKGLMFQNTDAFSCCWCNKYFCEKCFDETFKPSPTAEDDEDICERCWTDYQNEKKDSML